MFSRRLPWTQQANALTSLLDAHRRRGARICDLTVSNPTQVGISYPDSVLASLADPRGLIYLPSPAGLLSAREAIAAHTVRTGEQLSPSSIVLTSSTSEAYSYLFKLLGDPGDSVLAPKPSYPLLEHLAALDGLTIVPYWLRYDGGWEIDFSSLAEALATARQPRAILVVNPNNPTGSYLKRNELAKLEAMANERNLALISDEVFADYPFRDDNDERRSALLASEARSTLCFSLGGLSKSAGLPQLKLGWIIVGGPGTQRARAIERLELIADTYLSVSTPVMLATPRLLERAESIRGAILERARANRSWLESYLLPPSPASLLAAEGGWYAVLRLPQIRSDEDLALHLLSNHNVLVHPGYFYDFPPQTYAVVSLLSPPRDLQSGIAAVVSASVER
ncbi:MAG: pyridoxal phosphate-dependent aminotransferase [Pseudomonadota bacterium]